MPKAKKNASSGDNKRLKRKGASSRVSKKKRPKRMKDPNKPKKAPTAFFVFLEEFRSQYKKNHPEIKSVSIIGKAAGDKWRAMSDAEKAPYVSRAEKRKVECDKAIRTYNMRLAEGTSRQPGDNDDNEEVQSWLNILD